MLILSFSITTKCRSCTKRRKSRIRRKGRKGGLGFGRCESDCQVSQSTKATPSFAKGQRCSEFREYIWFRIGRNGRTKRNGQRFRKSREFRDDKGYRNDIYTTNRTNTREEKSRVSGDEVRAEVSENRVSGRHIGQIRPIGRIREGKIEGFG